MFPCPSCLQQSQNVCTSVTQEDRKDLAKTNGEMETYLIQLSIGEMRHYIAE
jgi:hypothetical protein